MIKRVGVVTGGYGVLGGAIAEGLARAAIAVAILGRRAEPAEAKAAAIRKAGGDASVLVAEVAGRRPGTPLRRPRARERGGSGILRDGAEP